MFLIFFCCIFFINCCGVLAITDEQKAMIHSHFEMLGKECIKDNLISADDIKNLRAKKIPSGENAPCFLACMFKKLGIMDDAGLLQKETVLDLARKVFNDEDEIKVIGDYLHSCSRISTLSWRSSRMSLDGYKFDDEPYSKCSTVNKSWPFLGILCKCSENMASWRPRLFDRIVMHIFKEIKMVNVNTESVSDGDKGCDRSMMAYKCMIENASQFGIEM